MILILQNTLKSRKNEDKDTVVSNCVRLKEYVKFCMINFSTYFMLAEITETNKEKGTEEDLTIITKGNQC